mgnify:CR=1 FL=1|jgi:hypothetical protein
MEELVKCVAVALCHSRAVAVKMKHPHEYAAHEYQNWLPDARAAIAAHGRWLLIHGEEKTDKDEIC